MFIYIKTKSLFRDTINDLLIIFNQWIQYLMTSNMKTIKKKNQPTRHYLMTWKP